MPYLEWPTEGGLSKQKLRFLMKLSLDGKRVIYSPKIKGHHEMLERATSVLRDHLLQSPILFFIGFLGVILVYNTIQVSVVQLNKTSSAHCIMYPWPKAESFCLHLSSLCPPPPTPIHFPSGYHSTLVCVCVSYAKAVQRVSSHVIWKIETFIEEDTRNIVHRTRIPQSPSK